jgi:aspartate carbamoyltransferase catalytic subunit
MTRTIKKVPALQGFTVGTLFFEDSTRTRLSFERAARAQSADVISFAAGGSSVSKGESLKDTLRTIDAMKSDLYVVRHPAAGAPAAADCVDGRRDRQRRRRPPRAPHPGAARRLHLQDELPRLRRLRGRQAGHRRRRRPLAGRAQQRRAVDEARRAGDAVRPAHAAPRRVRRHPRRHPHAPRRGGRRGRPRGHGAALQHERMAGGLLPSLAEYRQRYQVTAPRHAPGAPGALVMHPGPMNRDVEIEGVLADDPAAPSRRRSPTASPCAWPSSTPSWWARDDPPPRPERPHGPITPTAATAGRPAPSCAAPA